MQITRMQTKKRCASWTPGSGGEERCRAREGHLRRWLEGGAGWFGGERQDRRMEIEGFKGGVGEKVGGGLVEVSVGGFGGGFGGGWRGGGWRKGSIAVARSERSSAVRQCDPEANNGPIRTAANQLIPARQGADRGRVGVAGVEQGIERADRVSGSRVSTASVGRVSRLSEGTTQVRHHATGRVSGRHAPDRIVTEKKPD